MSDIEALDKKLPYKWIYAILALIAIILFVNSITPLNFDEVVFAVQGRDVGLGKAPDMVGITHPPLYVYFLGLVTKLFGDSTLVFRATGFFFFIVNYLLLILLAKKVVHYKFRSGEIINDAHRYLGDAYERISLLVLSALYILCPLILQQGMVLDIDVSIHTAFAILTLLAFINLLHKDAPLS